MLKHHEEILKQATVTLEKYRKNKTLVPPEDLAGKYKVPFQNLKRKLADEISCFIKAYILEGLQFSDDNTCFEGFARDVDRIFKDSGIGKRAGMAVFKDFDMAQVERIAEELRVRVYEEAWVPYFQKHVCLYADARCFLEDNPQTPRIYNSLVDMFWDEQAGQWVKDETACKPAVLVFIQEDRNEQE